MNTHAIPTCMMPGVYKLTFCVICLLHTLQRAFAPLSPIDKQITLENLEGFVGGPGISLATYPVLDW